MEQDLQVPLLTRSTRHVALTAEGRLLLEECRQIVAQFDKSIKRTRSISSGLAGELDVGCNDFAFLAELPTIVQLFRARFPEIAIRLHEGQRSDQLEALTRGDLDLSFVIGPANAEGLASLTTGRYPLTVLVANSHPLARRKNLKLAELSNEPFIFGSRLGWEAYRALIDSIFYAAEFDPRIILEVYGSVAIFGLVAAGLGVSLYPDCQLQVQYRNFAVRPLADVARQVETTAVWFPRSLTRAAGHFVEFIQAYRAASGSARCALARRPGRSRPR